MNCSASHTESVTYFSFKTKQVCIFIALSLSISKSYRVMKVTVWDRCRPKVYSSDLCTTDIRRFRASEIRFLGVTWNWLSGTSLTSKFWQFVTSRAQQLNRIRCNTIFRTLWFQLGWLPMLHCMHCLYTRCSRKTHRDANFVLADLAWRSERIFFFYFPVKLATRCVKPVKHRILLRYVDSPRCSFQNAVVLISPEKKLNFTA